MTLTHLPTLDGSTETAVARLEALGRQHDLAAVENGIWEADQVVREMHELISPSRDCQEKFSSLRSDHEALLTRVQHEVDRLLGSVTS